MAEQQFLLHKIFNGKHMVTLSDDEIAKRCRISKEKVREYVDHDVSAGLCIELRQKSTYYLTFHGLDVLCKEYLGVIKSFRLPESGNLRENG